MMYKYITTKYRCLSQIYHLGKNPGLRFKEVGKYQTFPKWNERKTQNGSNLQK